MKVVGITTQHEAYVGSKDRSFRMNEFLIVEDIKQGDLLGEVVEVQTFNRYIPLDTRGDFVDGSVLESLKSLGYNIDEETIYLAKLRLLNEALYPIETGSDLRSPEFSEVENIVMKSTIEEGLVLGVIKNTDAMYEGMDPEYKKLVYTFEEDGIKEQRDIPYIMDLRSMHQYPHVGIFGGSGSGKSFGLRVFLEELMRHSFPSLVIDPHFEMDFTNPASYLGEGEKRDYGTNFQCLQLGRDIGVKFEELDGQDLKNLLNAVSNLTDSMKNVVDILFRPRDSYTSFKNRLQNLLEAQEIGSPDKIQARIDAATKEVERSILKDQKELYERYDKNCPNASIRGIYWRLTSLEKEGVFSKDIVKILDGLMAGQLIVIQGNTRILQVFSTYLFNNLYHRRRSYKDAVYRKMEADYFPPFLVITDEAHNFAPKNTDSPAKGILREISQEGRKYGVFLVLATQRPTLLDDTITAQLNTKFIFRTVRASDIQTIREETDLTPEEANRLPYLKTGDVFISSAVMGRTAYSRIRAANTTSPHTENPFDELKRFRDQDSSDFYGLIESQLPILETNLLDLLSYIEEEAGLVYNMESLALKLQDLVREGRLDYEETGFVNRYVRKEE